jgi:membrane protease YdiL (CAAX protease family)
LNRAENVPLILAEPDTPSWGFGEVFIVIAAFVVAMGGVGLAAMSLLGDSAKKGYWTVIEEVIAYLLVLLAIKVILFWQQKPLFRTLGWLKTPMGAGALVSAGLALFAASVVLQLVLRTPEVTTPFEKMLQSDIWSRIAITIFGVTAGPVVEELLFRGFLQPVLVDTAGVFPGILITSAIFGAMHLAQNAGMWQTFVIITMAGFGFGVVRHLTGSTQASTISHIAYNSLPFLVTTLQSAHPAAK